MSPIRLALFLAFALPFAAQAQDHAGHMMHHDAMAAPAAPAPAPAAAMPLQAGQAAFAAIQEIAAILEADPATDWSKVDLEALRRHLIDMDNVTLSATVAAEPLDDGLRFTVTGADDEVAQSIRRMVTAHATTMNGTGGWSFTASSTAAGAILTVHAPPQDLAKLRGLGFIGVMTRGMHHQAHHLMIARGMHPH
jgi:hypothetical protein